MRALPLVLGIVLASGCESSPALPHGGGEAPTTRARPELVDLANDLAALANVTAATREDLAALASANYSSAAFSRYIDQLLQRPEFGDAASDVLGLGAGARSIYPMATLKVVELEGASVYYLHKTCTRAEAVSVHPWWDLSSSVLVCADAYRPSVFRAPSGAYCSGSIASPKSESSPCGCGPNLMRCVRNEHDIGDLLSAIYDESSETVRHVVTNDLPLETLFLARETFRTGLAEMLYEKWLVEDGWAESLEDFPNWKTWPTEGKWAPRPQARAEQHAGIFTNLGYPNTSDSQRLRLYQYFDTLWCAGGDSLRVETSAVLDLGKHIGQNLRSNVKANELAGREGCGDCHARLDYGVQFFAGDKWFHQVDHYLAREQLDTPGPLYNANLQDPRGTSRRNPVGFVELALAQPEYPMCTSKRVIDYVFGVSDPTLATLDETLRDIVRRRGTFRELFKLALETYKDRELARRGGPARVATAGPTSLHARVTELCSDCHDGEATSAPGRLLEGGASWCSSGGDACTRDAVDMIKAVAYGGMPKGAPLPDAERGQLIEALAPIAYPDPTARKRALAFFLTPLNQRPTFGPQAVSARLVALAAERTGAEKVNVPRPRVLAGPHYSVNLGIYATLVALTACRAAADQSACVRASLDDTSLLEK